MDFLKKFFKSYISNQVRKVITELTLYNSVARKTGSPPVLFKIMKCVTQAFD